MDPFRLRVMKALCDALKAITPANGYQVDLGPGAKAPNGKVFRGRKYFGDSDPLPMIAVLENPIPLEPLMSAYDASEQAGGWSLTVQGFCEDDKENPSDPAHVFMADVKKALAAEKRRAGAHGQYIFGMKEITGLEIGIGTVQVPDDVSSKAYFVLGLVVHMVEDLNDPYA